MKLCVIGCGYVGLVTSTCFAETGNHVIAVEKDQRRIDMLRKGNSPIYEPGLDELMTRNIAKGRLSFSDDLPKAIDESDYLFICVGTPPAPDGSTDLTAVLDVARTIGKNIKSYKIIIMKSTVPVGTCKKAERAIAALTDVEFDVTMNPEFLKEGAALDDFFRPDRVVVGASTEKGIKQMRYLYQPFLRTGKPFIAMCTESAEMTKHASNAMLAARISFINEISHLCEIAGADVEEVRRGMAADRRIGPAFLFPGLGFGGSCFPKDLRSLAHVGKSQGARMYMSEAASTANLGARQRFLDRIALHFDNDLNGKTLAFWGLAFKPRTDDIREAPSIWLIQNILERWPDAVIRAHDPIANEQARRVLDDKVVIAENDYEILKDADALIICTEWNEFRSPDFELIKNSMRVPVIFDGRNLYDTEMIRESGITYYSVGRLPVIPE